MNVSYDHYRVFYYVAKYGSFTRAAKALYCNQPNLTRTVHALESTLGCTLFVRSNKGVRLTDEGERLYAHVEAAMEHFQAGEAELLAAKSLEGGIVTLGATEIALRIFLLPILNAYRNLHPGIRIKLANVSTPQALSMLREGLLDLAVVTTPLETGGDLNLFECKRFREVPVCGKAFRELAASGEREAAELCRYPMISLGAKSSTHQLYSRFFFERGCTLSLDIEAATADQILPLVKHNLGIGFVPEEWTDEHGTEDVMRIPLRESLPERAVCLVKRKGHRLSLPAGELDRMLREAKKEKK
ncbi:MAG: LysR family transcriptional regulator [Clostridia bacterium]|nr:LysR family transcriptional regulator [Clostridia bacterium]